MSEEYILHSQRRKYLKSYNVQFPQDEDIKYPELHIDRRLIWRKRYLPNENLESRSPKLLAAWA
jgi:hypothetical protein